MIHLFAACATPDPTTDTADTGDPADTADSGTVDTVTWPSDTGLPDCAVADLTRDTAGRRADCIEELVTSSSCDQAPDSVTQEGLLFAGTAYLDGLYDVPMATITDAVSWDALLAEWGPDAPTDPVDFDTELVVIVQDHINSTCGAEVLQHGVWDPSPPEYAVWVYVRFRDTTGSCAGVCDMEQPLVVAYRVPRDGGYPVVCADVVNECAS